MIENDSMNEGDRRAMMISMMEQFFSGMGPDEKKKMFATLMGEMTEGIDMKEVIHNTMTSRSIVSVSYSSSSSS